MKYIIEFEDEPYMSENGVNYYTCKSARWYKLGETVINRLTPYTEPDRKAVENEVWEFAKKIGSFNGLSKHDLDECFGHTTIQGVMTTYDTYQEAKDKYEAWLKKKDEIRVGDVVVYIGDPNKEKAIVLRLYQPKQYKTLADILCDDGTVVKMVAVENLAWTGKHFDEVEEMLKKMGEE